MASFQSDLPKLFTRDLAAYSDAELDRYLKANGGDVDVEDYENLMKDEVLIERLRMRAGANDTTQSRPIDLDALTARLQHISADRQAQRPPSQTGTDYRSRDTTEPLVDEEEDYCRDLKRETEYYNILVGEGGRPSHPVSLGRDILEDPGEYREIILYWQLYNGDAEGRVWKVFESQMGRWRRFRGYQQYTREEGRFTRHCQRVQERLTRHGFERPFQLNEDLDGQDKLATWIEFLNYEYQDYDKDMRFVKRHQPQYNEAWKELVDSQVLRPSETEEFICNIDSAFQHASERERAEKAVEAAKSAVMSAQKTITDPRRSNLSEKEAQQRLVAVQSRLDAAIKSLESIKRRDDLVYEFYKKTQLSQITNDGRLKRSYQEAKDDAERRSILLRWIVQQVPLIELELVPVKVAENDSNAGSSGRRGLKRNCVDESKERVSKRQRQDGECNPISDRRTRASTAKERESQLKRSRHDSMNQGRPSKRPKRNSQKRSLFPHETSDAADPTSIGAPLSIQPHTTQDSRATAAESAKARSIGYSPPRKTRSEARTPVKVVLDSNARVIKRGRGGGKSSNLSTLGSSPRRRSTRIRKPPDRFQ